MMLFSSPREDGEATVPLPPRLPLRPLFNSQASSSSLCSSSQSRVYLAIPLLSVSSSFLRGMAFLLASTL
jgi:hypothetical protein